jgi:hypothetical protein
MKHMEIKQQVKAKEKEYENQKASEMRQVVRQQEEVPLWHHPRKQWQCRRNGDNSRIRWPGTTNM